MAKKAKKAAGRRSPAQKKQGGQVDTAQQSGHRDPIVADNADVRIDFTKPPQDLDDGKLWARRFTSFKMLESKFDGVIQPAQNVKDVSSLTFTYSKPGNGGRDEELVFTSTGQGAVLVAVKVDKFKQRSSNDKRHLVPANLRGLRLRTVNGVSPAGGPFTINLFKPDGRTPKFGDVVVTIVANEEDS